MKNNEPKYIQKMGERGGKTHAMFATFRKNMTIIRVYRGHTQSEFGVILEMRPKLISDFETGRMHPKMEHVFKIAKALNVSVGELMDKTITLNFE